MQSVFILGRQPELGLAELESLYGAKKVLPVGKVAALLDVAPDQVDFERLGGSVRFAKLLIVLDSHDWRDIERFLIKACPDQAAQLPEGKLTLGISAYGLKASPRQIEATGLSIKKAVKKSGRPVRLVPNKDAELNTAQVLHNKLTDELGWELLLIRDGNRTILAQTVRVQDIESYTVRDRERPKRDTRVGMLPPKLAQILINLSVGQLQMSSQIDYIDEEIVAAKPKTGIAKTTKSLPAGEDTTKSARTSSAHASTAANQPDTTVDRPIILDPFCGTGVVLQEALLTGYGAYGTDLEPRMVDYSTQNIDWLRQAFEFAEVDATIERGDATTHQWTQLFTNVACETYLGRPFTNLPNPEILNRTISECNTIIKKFLKNIGHQIKPGTRLCLAVPAWQQRPGYFKHLPLLGTSGGQHLDSLEELGYNRISFEHVRNEDLLYYRSDQVVARELLVLVKK